MQAFEDWRAINGLLLMNKGDAIAHSLESRGEKVERFKDIAQLKKDIIRYLFAHMETKARNRWWQFKGNFVYEGMTYNLECECKWDNEVFTYRNMFIEHEQKVIDITDMAGLIN